MGTAPSTSNNLIYSELHKVWSGFYAVASPNIFTLLTGVVAEYCDEHVCLCVCLSVSLSVHQDIFGTTGAIFTSFSLHVAYGRGSVLLWQGDEIPRGRGNFRGFLPHWQCIVTRLLHKRSFIANNFMQQKGSFRRCRVRCKWISREGVIAVQSAGEVWSTIALYSATAAAIVHSRLHEPCSVY